MSRIVSTIDFVIVSAFEHQCGVLHLAALFQTLLCWKEVALINGSTVSFSAKICVGHWSPRFEKMKQANSAVKSSESFVGFIFTFKAVDKIITLCSRLAPVLVLQVVTDN
jgi:hypothetical protein